MTDTTVKDRDFDLFEELSRKVTDALVSVFDQYEKNQISVHHLYARVQGLYDASAGLLDEEAQDNLDSAMSHVNAEVSNCDSLKIPFVAIQDESMVMITVKHHNVVICGINAGTQFNKTIECDCYLAALSKARSIATDKFKDWEWTI